MAGKNKKTPLPKATNIARSNKDDDDEDEEDDIASFKPKFSMLISDEETAGGDDNEEDKSDEEIISTKAAPVSTSTGGKKKGAKKKTSTKGTKQDDEIDSLLAAIEGTSVSTKKSDKKSKSKAPTTTSAGDTEFNEGEGQDLEDILKEIDEKFDEKDRRKKEKKRKKKEEIKEEPVVPTKLESKPDNQVEQNQEEKVPVSPAIITVPEHETTAAAATTDEKKPSSKSKKKAAAEKKGKSSGVDSKTLSIMKEVLRQQEEARIRAIQEDEERQRLEEELEQQRLEKQRLEKERKEKKKQKEKERIQRKKEEGTYLTKEQREKLERARIQLEAAGVQVPARHVATSANGEQQQQAVISGKKRVLYDDRRKKTQTKDMVESTTPAPTKSIDTTKKEPVKEEHSLKDDWEEESEDETTTSNVDETQRSEISAENGRSEIQSETNIPSKMADEENNESSESDSDEEESSDESEESSSSTDEDDNDPTLSPMARVRRRLQRRHEVCEGRRSADVLRAPVICVLGHVDTGKTKILDNLRRTHVQDGEAGGITQQIGATNVPLETIRERTKMCRKLVSREGDYLVPGLLIIDTPGHESFKNLRSRGSSLCDLAILVVDIMHGLEPQTLESIQLLLDRKTPFIIALNKIDRLYNWKGDNKKNIELVLQEQIPNTRNEFETRCKEVVLQFAERGLNAALYYENKDQNEYFSMVPTSAHTGDGMGSLIGLIIERCQTVLAKRLSYTDELQATVMEVKAIGGLGTTIDVILVNGRLHVGDSIIVAGQEGPIVTQVRGLLMPEPNKELRVRNQYQNYKEVKAARGIKIAAKDLEKAMAGLPLFVGRNENEIEYFKNEIQNILKSVLTSIKLKENGVHVQASTLGSLEALLEFLKTSNLPYSSINIGPVHRKDVVRASTQLERDPQWAVILAFDVKIEKDAQDYADNVGVIIFQADIIYHLFDMFTAHRERRKKENQDKFRHLAVFPCKLKVFPQFIFNSRDPIICGVMVEDGFVRLGTPICVPSKDFIELGRVVSLEVNHKAMDIARKGQEVCIKIEPVGGEAPKMFGRHFDENDLLISKISRESIDVVKDHFRDDMQKTDWQLMIELKKTFNII